MTLNAFGLEGRVGAAWADAPPFSPKSMVLDGVGTFAETELGLPFLGSLIGERVFQRMKSKAEADGFDVEKNLPEKNLPMGPSIRRPLSLTTTADDSIVPKKKNFDRVLRLLEDHTDK